MRCVCVLVNTETEQKEPIRNVGIINLLRMTCNTPEVVLVIKGLWNIRVVGLSDFASEASGFNRVEVA